MDMNRGRWDIAKAFLPQAKIVIDRFHVIRYCAWAMDDVRRSSLSDEDESAVDVMLNFSEKLYRAYALKELFFNFMDAKNRSEAAELLSIWFNACDWLMLPEFMACRRLLKNWKPYILNAFDALSPTASPMAETTPLKPSNAWPLVSVISATSAPAFYAL